MPCALPIRSEEHTSELQSHSHLVCRLLLEKKKKTTELQSRVTVVCGILMHNKQTLPSLPVHTLPRLCADLSVLPCLLLSFFFFFFKGSGPPRNLPFSPTRALPI